MKLKLFVALSGCLVHGAQASGFALVEQNASGMGNAYAGQAAVAEDASIVFFNPAGLTRLNGRQVVVAGHLIMPSAKFTDSGASTLSPFSLGDGGDAGTSALVPNLYFAMPLGRNLNFGLGINSPFGLVTEYDAPWTGQTLALKSDLKTVNVNPSLGWKLNDSVSLGFGLNWQWIDAELTQSATAPGVTKATMKGDDDSWGWNAGALFNLGSGDRIGVAYRSSVKQRLSGHMSVGAVTNQVTADLNLPASASVSYFRPVNSRWDFLADLTWTEWSSFDQLAVIKVSGPLPQPAAIQENWQDTWRASLGLSLHQSRELTWRVGVAYDQTPVPDPQHRTPRIPDNNRTWLALGGQYRWSPASAVDFGYAHIFVPDSRVNHTENGVTLSGSYDNKIDILSVQYTHNF